LILLIYKFCTSSKLDLETVKRVLLQGKSGHFGYNTDLFNFRLFCIFIKSFNFKITIFFIQFYKYNLITITKIILFKERF